MDDINMNVPINITDLEACILAIEDGNAHIALEILQEIVEHYDEEATV